MTFAARYNDGTAWFVQALPSIVDGPARAELDHALADAFRAVKKWE